MRNEVKEISQYLFQVHHQNRHMDDGVTGIRKVCHHTVQSVSSLGFSEFSFLKKKFPERKNNKGSIKYVENITDSLHGENVCFTFTDWSEVKALNPTEYKKLMRTPIVYDRRNIYDFKEMKDAGVEYYSIGR